MMKFIGIFLTLISITFGQTGTKPANPPGKLPPGVPAAPTVVAGREEISGRTYSNPSLGFEITFPEGWIIAGDDLTAEAKKSGIDLSLKAPDDFGAVSRIRLDRSLKNVSMLVAAYRSVSGAANSAVVRVSLENLSPNPQIKDAVDYFDAIRNEYRKMNLPEDFRYSETQAERLGKQQFAFLDLSNKAGKKRLYATVRRGYAILFSLSYSREDDLQAIRRVFAEGNFALK